MVRVVEARYVRDYVIGLRFYDGLAGEVDLRDELDGPVFEPLRELRHLAPFACIQSYIRSSGQTNGADLAPEFLYERVRVPA